MCRASTNTPGNLAISWNFSTTLLLEERQKTLITLTSPRTVTITGGKKKKKKKKELSGHVCATTNLRTNCTGNQGRPSIHHQFSRTDAGFTTLKSATGFIKLLSAALGIGTHRGHAPRSDAQGHPSIPEEGCILSLQAP